MRLPWIIVLALAGCAPAPDPLAPQACATRACTCDSFVSAARTEPLFAPSGDAYCPEGFDLRVKPRMVVPPVPGAAPIPEWRFR